MLKKFRSNAENYILSDTESPIEPRKMQYQFARILKNVNLPSVKFHSLRHCFASRAVEQGVDIKTLSEILGHSRVEVTVNTPKGHTPPTAVIFDNSIASAAIAAEAVTIY